MNEDRSFWFKGRQRFSDRNGGDCSCRGESWDKLSAVAVYPGMMVFLMSSVSKNDWWRNKPKLSIETIRLALQLWLGISNR